MEIIEELELRNMALIHCLNIAAVAQLPRMWESLRKSRSCLPHLSSFLME